MTTGAPLFWGRVACCIGGAADCRQERCRFRVPSATRLLIIRDSTCRNDETPAYPSGALVLSAKPPP